MSYTALYRKYRPEKFSDVIGQEHITRTLQNQIKLGRIGHAYLFTGSRGVGKTTCARIFARAINCIKGDGEPCGECEPCKKLSQPNNLDIIEIDAASNNGVDEARELKERVKYPPVNGKYKVFIIDEAHMLTGGAANALLKTLEEPPQYAVFILATTEAHKLPATILSRCMRFDFRLVGLQTLEELLEKVLREERKESEPEAIRAIALAGEGSVRDTLSIADKCFSASSGKLTYDDVMALIGGSDESSIEQLFVHIMDSDVSKSLVKLSSVVGQGRSPTLIAKELSTFARNILLTKAAPQLVSLPEPRKQSLTQLAQNLSASEVACVMEIFDKVGGELRLSTDPVVTLEIAVFKACKLFGLDVSALETRVARLEKKLSDLNTVHTTANTDTLSDRKESPETETNKAQTEQIKSATETSVQKAEREQESQQEARKERIGDIPKSEQRIIWGRILTYLRSMRGTIIYNLFAEKSNYTIANGAVTIPAENKEFLMLTDPDVIRAFDAAVDALGYDLKLKVVSPMTDKNRELEKIKKMIGDTPVKVID